MPGLKNAFKRDAKLKQHSVTRHRMHWRNRENGYDVVSSVLHDEWSNATHPAEHDDFKTTNIGSNDELTRYVPEDRSEWETFNTEETHMPRIHDSDAYNQFLKAFRKEVDILNAEAAADFLTDTFEASYELESDDPYSDCTSCEGTGRVCGVDDCGTYCYSGCGSDDESLRIGDSSCSCTSCNIREHWTECDNCDGAGEVKSTGFTRNFPYTRSQILSEMPSRKELQVLQFTLNKMANVADEQNTLVSPRQVLELFDKVENGDAESLISTSLSYVEPMFDTVEVPEKNDEGNIVTDEQGSPVMTEKTDTAQVEQTRTKLSSLLGVDTSGAADQQTA